MRVRPRDAEAAARAASASSPRRIDAAGRLAAGPRAGSRARPSGRAPARQRTCPASRHRAALDRASWASRSSRCCVLIGIAAWPRLVPRHKKTTARHVHDDPQGRDDRGRRPQRRHRRPTARSSCTGSRSAAPTPSSRSSTATSRRQRSSSRRATARRVHVRARRASPPPSCSTAMPTGATVEIDGKPVGTTPMTLTDLAAARHRRSRSRSRSPATRTRSATKLAVPGPGKELRMVQPLQVADDFARVKLVSPTRPARRSRTTASCSPASRRPPRCSSRPASRSASC